MMDNAPTKQLSPALVHGLSVEDHDGVPQIVAPKPRTCMLCRQRKTRCDRGNPCDTCTRAGIPCVVPSGSGRAPKRPRRLLDARIFDRLSRLESIVQQARSQTDPETQYLSRLGSSQSTSSTLVTKNEDLPTPSDQASEKPDSTESLDCELGRLLIDDTRSCYTSNTLWVSLSDEIEELRDILLGPGSENDDAQPVSLYINPGGTSAAILGYRAAAGSLTTYHPSLTQLVALFDTFRHNVNPLVRIFHMPTLTRTYWDVIASLDSLDKNIEALMFAIYYSSVITLDTDQCQSLLGISRSVALETYRFAVEQALARANLLNTQSMVLLQAVVLFLSVLPNEDHSRTVWSLTALVCHLAQSIGLHRDGTVFGLRPLEAELRRRTWWYICLLDARCSDNYGCEPIVNNLTHDARLPLNINDSDLAPGMLEAPKEREGATEMTFYLMRCEAIISMRKIVSASARSRGQLGGTLPAAERKALVDELRCKLEDRFLKYCDPTIPILLVSSLVGRIIIARTKVMIHHPFSQGQQEQDLTGNVRDELFITAINVLELSSTLLIDESLRGWNWHSKTHIQWQTVAFILSEICSRPPSVDCDRAWKYANIVYDRWQIKENQKKSNAWRPIKRLMAKARYIREMQLTRNNNDSRLWQTVSGIAPVLDDDKVEIDAFEPDASQISASTSEIADLYNALDRPSMDPLNMFANTSTNDQQGFTEQSSYMTDLMSADLDFDFEYNSLFHV